jgi:hypothetical protein
LTSLRTRLGTSLGTSLGTDLSGSSVDPTAPILALLPYSFAEADYYSVDGVTGKVASYLDKVAAGTGIRAIVPSHAFAQSTSAKQCALPAADSNFNGALSAQFPAAPYYGSNALPAAWQFQHNGTGMDVFNVWMPLTIAAGSKAIECTSLAGGSTQSCIMFWNTANLATLMYGGAAGTTSLATQNAGTLVANVPIYTEQTYIEGGTAALPFEINRFIKSVSVQAQNSVAAPYLFDSDGTLTIGGTGNGTLLANMAWCSRICFNRVLTAAERTIVRTYITTKYGVT